MEEKIREINFYGLKIGGEGTNDNFLASKPIFALELNIFNFDASSHIVKDYYSECGIVSEKMNTLNSNFSPLGLILKAQESDCDILALKFNIPEDNLDVNIKAAKELLKALLPHIKKPLLVRGINNKSVDAKLLPALMDVLDVEGVKVIIAFADENTYKDIVPSVVKGGHILAIRTPIDINLAKEMNILTSDMGLSLDKILIDTDMGGLGYGLEYGYSIMERIKLAAFEGDKMLNLPLIAFAGEEALKAKETKSDTFDQNFGNFKMRSKMFEIATASAIIAAGANLIVLENPESIKVLKELLNG